MTILRQDPYGGLESSLVRKSVDWFTGAPTSKGSAPLMTVWVIQYLNPPGLKIGNTMYP